MSTDLTDPWGLVLAAALGGGATYSGAWLQFRRPRREQHQDEIRALRRELAQLREDQRKDRDRIDRLEIEDWTKNRIINGQDLHITELSQQIIAGEGPPPRPRPEALIEALADLRALRDHRDNH